MTDVVGRRVEAVGPVEAELVPALGRDEPPAGLEPVGPEDHRSRLALRRLQRGDGQTGHDRAALIDDGRQRPDDAVGRIRGDLRVRDGRAGAVEERGERPGVDLGLEQERVDSSTAGC